jgi:hypothetical protein
MTRDTYNFSIESKVNPLHGPEECPDNVHGILRLRKPAVIVLQDAGNALGGEPGDGVVLREGLEGAFHEALAPRVSIGQAPDSFEIVGEIAPSAAGDGHFGERFAPRFKDGDLSIGLHLTKLRGAVAPRRSGSDDGNSLHYLCVLRS